MEEWRFIPWNMQYLGGGLVALAITVLVFRRDPQTTTYRCFLAYGASVAVWMFSVFFARSAPSLGSSITFYRSVIFCFPLVQPLLLLTVLRIGSKRRVYYLTLFPAIFLSFFTSAGTLFDVSWTSYGWAYSLTGQFLPLSLAIIFSYPAVVIVVLLVLVVKSKLLYLRKKYSFILTGFLLYFIPLTITNVIMWRDPNVRPFGGFLLTMEFLFIAYALYLKPEKIEFAGSQPADTVNDHLFKFVRRLRETMPGRELGGDAARFEDVLQSLGLRNAVHDQSSRQIFDTTALVHLDVRQTMDRITGFMRSQQWALPASPEYTDLFVELYGKMSRDSAAVAGSWLEGILRRHGGFLDRQGVLAALPAAAELPPIFQELPSGGVHLIREEKPVQAYEKLNKALEYGFEGICFTKLEPQKIRATYGVEKAAIFWLTFQPMSTEEGISPKDLERLASVVSLGLANSGRTIVLFDCLDQIILANPLEKVRGLMAGLKKLRQENGATFLVSINSEMLDPVQMNVLEEDLGTGGTS